MYILVNTVVCAGWNGQRHRIAELGPQPFEPVGFDIQNAKRDVSGQFHYGCQGGTGKNQAGIDGLIIVDLPPEEDDELCLPTLDKGLAFIRLATPTTDEKRLPAVLANTAGFVYYVSITGITGTAKPNFDRVAEAVGRIRRHTDLPIVVGFGVRTGADAAAIARGADGVVVGSALVDAMRATLDAEGASKGGTVEAVSALVRELAEGVRSSPRA